MSGRISRPYGLSFWARYEYPYDLGSYGGGGAFVPYEANPIYTSLSTSLSYSGSRTKLTTYAPPSSVRVTEEFDGSTPEWTWDRAYPTEYTWSGDECNSRVNARGFFVPGGTIQPHQGWFSLAPSFHVRPPLVADPETGEITFFDPTVITNYFDPKRQTLAFYTMGGPPYPESREKVVVGTRTTVTTLAYPPYTTTVTEDIEYFKYPWACGDSVPFSGIPRFLGSGLPRTGVTKWGFQDSLGDFYGEDVTAWSATKWRDYRGSYSAVIPTPATDYPGWDSSDVETTINWTLG